MSRRVANVVSVSAQRSTLQVRFARVLLPSPRFDYASRHLHCSIPGIHRLLRLRRMAGLGPPFSPIPKRQRRYKRYVRLVARVQQLVDTSMASPEISIGRGRDLKVPRLPPWHAIGQFRDYNV
jgi:hypothetical protein